MGHRRKPALISDVKVESPGLSLTYPKVSGLKHKSAESSINRYIKKEIHGLLKEKGYGEDGDKKFTGGYTVKLNRRGTLCIILEIYCYKKGDGHGTTYRKFVNVSLKDARVYHLVDLFSRRIKKAKFIERLNDIIRDQIKLKAIKTFEDFSSILIDHTYYLTENSLVICYELLELTPLDNGLLEFVIPFSEIEDIINTKGPIGRLLRDKNNNLIDKEETADE